MSEQQREQLEERKAELEKILQDPFIEKGEGMLFVAEIVSIEQELEQA